MPTVSISRKARPFETRQFLNIQQMTEVRRRKISSQFIGYFSVALIGYIVDLSSLFIIHELLKIHYLVATVLGFIFGLTVVYLLSSRYVFGESKIKSKSIEIGTFCLIGIIGLGILGILMWLFVDVIGIHYITAKITATIFVYTWNFFARRAIYHN